MSVEPKRGYYLLNTDGGRKPGGPATIGAVLQARRLVWVDHLSKAVDAATHNEAEYRGLIEGLELALSHGIERIRVYMDSELVVDQMNGRSLVKEAQLIKLHSVAQVITAEFKSIRLSWIPREMNVEADQLARKALSQGPSPTPS